eukprot:jgi/Chlat1/3826/Chrsp26S03973
MRQDDSDKSEAPGVAQALVLKSHDLVKLITKVLPPKDCARAMHQQAVEGRRRSGARGVRPEIVAFSLSAEGSSA